MKMDKRTENAYKRICFHGRGTAARWLDRGFFALLGGVCLYLLCRNRLLSALMIPALLAVSLLWEQRRWTRFSRDLWQKTVRTLKREAWLREEAAAIRQTGGVVLYPTPEGEKLTGLCLRQGEGTAFHTFGEAREELIVQAKALGCTVSFHPWQEGSEPGREQVQERLKRDAPKRTGNLWRTLLSLPGNRYLLAGCAMLLLSMVLRRALYWRLLGSLCLLLGALRRGMRTET